MEKGSTYALEVVPCGYPVPASQIAAFQGTTWEPHRALIWFPNGLGYHITPLSGSYVVTEFSQSNSGWNHMNHWNRMISYIPPENFMFANDGNPDCHPGPTTNVPAPPFSAQDARRLIDHGLRLWDGRPRVREVVWREGRRWYRLRATNFRLLLEWRWHGRQGWRPSYYRWH